MEKSRRKIRTLSALEVANICGVVNQTAINWIKSGHLEAFTTPGGQYRVYAEELVHFLKERNMRIPESLTEFLVRDRKILIIDDDEELNTMLKNYFERKLTDVDIHQAFDGFEAGRLVTELLPRIIILDIDLPGVNGHKLCSIISNDERLKNPVIISISGLNADEERIKILEEGATAFFPKPLDFDGIIKIIDSCL